MSLDENIPIDYGIIYCVTNKINGKKYIGQTIRTLDRRMQFHIHDAFKRNFANCFCRALRKHGKDVFEWRILMPAIDQDHLNLLEDYWIRVFNTLAPNGYNLKTGGSHGKPTDITRQLIRKTVKKLWQNPEYAKAMSDAHKNHYPKIKKSMKRLWQNPEYAEMMSKAHIGKYMGAKHSRAKAVKCIETGIIYGSMHEATRETGINRRCISFVVNGQHKTAGGFYWQFIVEDLHA